jgi:glucose-6-phosphate isomerase
MTQPFQALIKRATGSLEPLGPVLERRVSDLRGLCAFESARARLEADGDPIVYRVIGVPVPEVAGEVPFSVTTILPGVIGEEFFFTKGHWHTAFEGEIYLGLEGRGILLAYNGTDVQMVELFDGAIGYIPPGWGHRTINTGSEAFKFLAIYPGAAGHDYQRVLEEGLGARVLRDGTGGYHVVKT